MAVSLSLGPTSPPTPKYRRVVWHRLPEAHFFTRFKKNILLGSGAKRLYSAQATSALDLVKPLL